MSTEENNAAIPRRHFGKIVAGGGLAAAAAGLAKYGSRTRQKALPLWLEGDAKGTLMPIGGGMISKELSDLFEDGKFEALHRHIDAIPADDLDPHGIIDRLLTLAQRARPAAGERPTLEIVAAGSENPPEAARLYQHIFQRVADAGGHKILIDILPADHYNDPAAEARMARAGGVFLTGGDQSDLVEKYGSTPACRRMVERWHSTSGFVVGGTSAGAMAMAGLEQTQEERVKRVMIEKRPPSLHAAPPLIDSLGLLKHALIDTHVRRRDRESHMLAAVTQHHPAVAVGLDEQTCLVIENGQAAAYGPGRVLVMGKGLHMANDSSQRLLPAHIALWKDCQPFTKVAVYCFRDGYGFSLADLAPRPTLPRQPESSLAGSPAR